MGDSDKSFFERVEEIRAERGSGKTGSNSDKSSNVGAFHEEVSQQTQWAIVVAAFLGGGFIGAIANPMQPVFAFIVMGAIFGGVAWVFATESGKAFREEVESQQQQQQSSGSSEPKVVCSECGWQNPKNNNYCHDCGAEL